MLPNVLIANVTRSPAQQLSNQCSFRLPCRCVNTPTTIRLHERPKTMIHNAFATPGRKTTLEGLRQRIDNRIIRPDVLSLDPPMN